MILPPRLLISSASARRYFSNTRTRFILVVEEPAPKDEDMRSVCRPPVARVLRPHRPGRGASCWLSGSALPE